MHSTSTGGRGSECVRGGAVMCVWCVCEGAVIVLCVCGVCVRAQSYYVCVVCVWGGV